jgi:hypothetical protein
MTFEATMAVIACTVIGLAALAGGVYQRTKLRSRETWPQVMGTIRKAEVIRDTGPDSSGYFVSVLYDYSVDGAPHQGSKIGLRQRAYIRKTTAQAVVDRYPPNTTVPVFFNPEKPSEAVLVREYPDNVLLMVCGIGLLTLVIVILVARH